MSINRKGKYLKILQFRCLPMRISYNVIGLGNQFLPLHREEKFFNFYLHYTITLYINWSKFLIFCIYSLLFKIVGSKFFSLLVTIVGTYI